MINSNTKATLDLIAKHSQDTQWLANYAKQLQSQIFNQAQWNRTMGLNAGGQ